MIKNTPFPKSFKNLNIEHCFFWTKIEIYKTSELPEANNHDRHFAIC